MRLATTAKLSASSESYAPITTGSIKWPLLPWLGVTLIATGLIVIPVVSIFYLALFPEENIWPHLAATVLPDYLLTTLCLMIGVGLGTALIGISCAWLVTMCEFPGRRFFTWALLLPFAIPAYVIAYVYTDLLEYAGPVQQYLRWWFGWNNIKDYWFPEIRSLGGAISMLSLVLYPYVYLLSRAAFLQQSPHLIDVSRILGQTSWISFFRVSLPSARPAIAVSLALVLMETLNDFGTVDYFAVRTLSAGIYDVWLGMGNLGGGAQIASITLIFVTLLVTLERLSRQQQKHFQTHQRQYGLARYQLLGWRSGLAIGLCSLILIFGFVTPVSLLLYYAISYLEQSWTVEFKRYALNSLLLSFCAAILALLLSLLLAYSRRLYSAPITHLALRSASLGYALPGTVLALGVMIPFTSFDNILDDFMRHYFDISTGLLLSGSVIAIIFAYVVRFLAVSLGAVESSLDKIKPSMDMAARSLGHGPFAVLWRIHLPLMHSGLLTAILIVFVDCMKELPATLILRPFNFDTLATYVYQFASDELLEECALGALLIVAVGLLPVILLSRSIDLSSTTSS